jgi:hypothetical protein
MQVSETYQLFAELQYPITTAALLEEVGSVSIDLANGEETVGAVFERLGATEFTDPMDAHLAFMSGLSSLAIGRKAYSDRDAPTGGFADRDPRAMHELLEAESRFKTDGPHCGICEHVRVVGDWDPMAFCQQHGEIIDPVCVGEVCEHYQQKAT